MDSDPGDTSDHKEIVPFEEGAEDVHHEEMDDVTLEEVLWQYRAVILDLDRRVSELENRPQFAATLRTKRTGL